jgi:hypothetical protein
MHPTVRRQGENLHHCCGAAALEVALIDDPSVDLHAELAHPAHQHRHGHTIAEQTGCSLER